MKIDNLVRLDNFLMTRNWIWWYFINFFFKFQ